VETSRARNRKKRIYENEIKRLELQTIFFCVRRFALKPANNRNRRRKMRVRNEVQDGIEGAYFCFFEAALEFYRNQRLVKQRQ
jgi:hypothetical protein